MKRKIIVAVSDTHGGHVLGLCNPNTMLESIDTNTITKYNPTLSETQKFIYEVYEWGKEEVIKLAKKDDIILIHNGDPTHGNALFLTKQSGRMSDQILIAQENIDVWLQYANVKMVRFAVGTGVHEMGEGSASLLVSELLRNKHPKVNIGVVYHGLLDIGGFLIDYAHHGPNRGSRKWLEGNELRYYLRSIMMHDIMKGKCPPHLVLRGHYHTYQREFLEIMVNEFFVKSWAVLLPGFTLKDDYTRQATKSGSEQHVGMVAFELYDNQIVNCHQFIKNVDLRTKESI